jgi:ribokinase
VIPAHYASDSALGKEFSVADIVVVGSLNMDLVVKAPRMPLEGETLLGRDFQMIPGGKGANQAAAAARLGAQVAMVGRVGGDAFGPPLIENLRCQGVDAGHVQIDDEAATGTAMIIVDDSGQNSIVVAPGANGRVSEQDVDRLEDTLSQARVLLLQFEVPLETVEYAIQMAARHQIKVILNPAPARPAPAELIAKVDYLVPNEFEASTLTGLETKDVPSAERAARKLLGFGVPVVIITLGERGALMATGQGMAHVPARRVQAVDTTAAGDAFIGGLAVALVKGSPLDEAVRYASCAGALAVTKFGAQTSLPSADEVQAFYESGVAEL